MNRLRTLPASLVAALPSLEQVDLRDNHDLTTLPAELAGLASLQVIELGDLAHKMCFPPAEVCAAGTMAVLEFLGKVDQLSFALVVSTTFSFEKSCSQKTFTQFFVEPSRKPSRPSPARGF